MTQIWREFAMPSLWISCPPKNDMRVEHSWAAVDALVEKASVEHWR
jgi:hypothetical protein